MAASVAIRDAGESDLAAIADAVADQPLLVRYGVTRAGLARSLAEARARGEQILVAEEGPAAPRVRGFAWFLDRGTFAVGGYLRLISLRAGDEGSGIGAHLLDEVERRTALASRHLFLLVSDFNHAAQRFYARRGYAEVGRLPGLVLADVTELVFHRRLR